MSKTTRSVDTAHKKSVELRKKLDEKRKFKNVTTSQEMNLSERAEAYQKSSWEKKKAKFIMGN